MTTTPLVRLLGPLEAVGERLPMGSKPRQVFALLAFQAGKVTRVSTLMQELWGNTPVRSADCTLQTYIYLIRKWLRLRLPEVRVEHDNSSYVLRVDPLAVDVHRFDHLAASARRLFAAGMLTEAEQRVHDALGLWRGTPLEGVRTGAVLDQAVASLEDRRASALALRFEIDLQAGRHREIVDELAELLRADPAREDVACRLMVALYRSDRRVDALGVYTRTRHTLIEAAGLEPGTALRRLQQQILNGDPALEWSGMEASGGAA